MNRIVALMLVLGFLLVMVASGCTVRVNPKEEKLIRHLGFSGHHSPPVMMEMLQRDTGNLLDGMLVAINANDRLNFNMQYNNIPVAAARKMGLIGMKTFADGSMYGKPPVFSSKPSQVIRTVGSPSLASHPLIRYSLTTPGICTLICPSVKQPYWRKSSSSRW